MSISRYANGLLNVAEELKDELWLEEYEKVRPTNLQSALEHQVEFDDTHRDIVRQMASATPAQRRKHLAKLGSHERFWITACAAIFARQAAHLLQSVEYHLQPIGSHREMLGRCGEFLEETRDFDDTFWLFPDMLLRDPE